MSCPIGYYKPDKDEPVRHCVDFSGLPDTIQVNLTPALNYREFKYNDKRKRISFLTQRNSFCFNPITRKVISQDPQCKEFDVLFKTINPHIPESALLYYDFIDTGDERFSYNELYAFKNIKILKELKDIAGHSGNATILAIYGVALVFLWNFYKNNQKQPKEDKKELRNEQIPN